MKRTDIIHLVLIIVFLGIAINLTITTIGMLKNRNRLRELESEVVVLQDKSSKINASIEYKKTDQFVDEFARNELNLVKPGEDVIVIARNSPNVSTSMSNFSNENIDTPANTKIIQNENVGMWLKLFF